MKKTPSAFTALEGRRERPDEGDDMSPNELLAERLAAGKARAHEPERIARSRSLYASDDDDQYLVEQYQGDGLYEPVGHVRWDAQFGAWVAYQNDGCRAPKTVAARWITLVYDYRWCRDQASGDRDLAVTLHHALYH